MATLRAVPPLGDLVADGVRLFLVLDYDGVFNAYSRNTLPATHFNPTHRQRHPNPTLGTNAWGRPDGPKSFELSWSSDLVDILNTLATPAHVQVVWLSTWREHMGDVMDRMGLSFTRPALYLPWASGNHDHGMKLPPFRHFFQGVADLAPDAAVAWADDVALADDLLALHDPLAGTFDPDRVLLLRPDSRPGLSRAEVASLVDFAARMSPDRAPLAP